jgi:hypothetical protein
MKKNLERLKYIISNNSNCSRYPVSVASIDNKMMYIVYLIEKYFIKEYNIKILQLKCNWIEDVSGRVYMMNLKEYKIASHFIKADKPQTIKESGSLPTISFVKKIKEIQDKSRVSVISLLSAPGLLNQ